MGMNFVFGIFSTKLLTEIAVSKLKADGFRNTDISLLFIQDARPEAPGHTPGNELGWLAGCGLMIVPGHGKCVAAGPLVAALGVFSMPNAMMGVKESTRNGVVGGLLKLELPEYEAKRYSGQTHAGQTLLAVHVEEEEWVKRAAAILKDVGANDMATSIQEPKE